MRENMESGIRLPVSKFTAQTAMINMNQGEINLASFKRRILEIMYLNLVPSYTMKFSC